MRRWADVATLTKTKSLTGRFVAQRATNLSFVVPEGCEVAFVPPQADAPRRAIAKCVNVLGDSRYEVEFEDVEGAQADLLVGCHLLVRRTLLEGETDTGLPAAWRDWSACSTDGSVLGRIEGVIENPAQSLLEIDRADGGGDLLVPVVDEFLVDVDAETRTVLLELPSGLLDL